MTALQVPGWVRREDVAVQFGHTCLRVCVDSYVSFERHFWGTQAEGPAQQQQQQQQGKQLGGPRRAVSHDGQQPLAAGAYQATEPELCSWTLSSAGSRPPQLLQQLQQGQQGGVVCANGKGGSGSGGRGVGGAAAVTGAVARLGRVGQGAYATPARLATKVLSVVLALPSPSAEELQYKKGELELGGRECAFS